MQRFARLAYTDGDGEPYDTQRTWLEEGFQTVALPFYVILRPDGSTIATFAGLTRNREEFPSPSSNTRNKREAVPPPPVQ